MIKRKHKTRTEESLTIRCQSRSVIIDSYGGTMEFRCPFCMGPIKVIKRSLQGTGEACKCGALFKMYNGKITAYILELGDIQ